MPEAKGIIFGVSPALPLSTAVGKQVTITWNITSNLPGKRLLIRITDQPGILIEQYEENLSGQAQPFMGTWKFVVPPTVLTSSIWMARGEFYPDSPDYPPTQPEASASIKFGVNPATKALRGVSTETITVKKKWAK